jgi:hypothetical protein
LDLIVVTQSLGKLVPSFPHVSRNAREVERLKSASVFAVELEVACIFIQIFFIRRGGRVRRLRIGLDVGVLLDIGFGHGVG